MTTGLTADAMLAALGKWGIVPKFHKPDWRTHNRNAAQGFGPIYGFVVHNFGSDTSDPNSLAYLYNGDNARGMPGPLSQFAITDDGQVWVIGWGTANHTGSMDPRLLDMVKRDAAPLSSDFKPNVNFGSAGATHNINDNFVGVEMTYGKAPTAAQRASVTLLAAALMDALGTGYTGGSVVGHRECTTDRSDPTGIPMWSLRRDVNVLLAAGPGRASSGPVTPAKPTPAPVATPPKEIDMQLTDKIPGTNPPITVAQALSRGAWAYEQIVSGGSVDRRINAGVSELGKLRAALAAGDVKDAQTILDRIEVSLTVKPETPSA